MSLLLGHLMSLLIDEVYILDIKDMKYKRGLLKALNKVIWVQNDLFGRHYLACAEGREEGGNSSAEEAMGGEGRNGHGNERRGEEDRLGSIEEEKGGVRVLEREVR
jgi:hypothetical protein